MGTIATAIEHARIEWETNTPKDVFDFADLCWNVDATLEDEGFGREMRKKAQTELHILWQEKDD